MHDAVDEVARVTTKEGIDCHLAKGGYLNLARTQPQVQRVHDLLQYYRSWGFGEEDYRWLPADEASARINATKVLGAGYTPHCAAIHPARLVRGLADAVERDGTTIYEQTRVVELGDTNAALRDRNGLGGCHRSGHRGVHRAAARPSSHRRPDLLADDRHRAASRVVLRARLAGRNARRSTTTGD